MAKLRVGILGLGQMGQNHLRVLSGIEQVEVVGIFDADPTRNLDLFKSRAVGSIDELMSKEIDYCVVSTPTSFHEEHALTLVKKNIHVLIEKPIALSYHSAKNIVQTAKNMETIVGVGHIERYNSALQKAREFIESGLLGELYQISTRRQGPNPGRIKDVGVVKDLATHDIDLTSWLADSRYKKIGAYSHSQSSGTKEDLIVINGLLENGVIVNHLVNWISPVKERKTIVTGEKGVLVINTLETELTYYEHGRTEFFNNEIARFKGVSQGDIHIFAFEKPEPLKMEHINFCKVIEGKDGKIVTAEEGAEAVRIAEAILKSAQLKETISL